MTLTLLFAALSGILMTLTYVVCPALSAWWCIPLWLGGYIAVGVLYLAVIITLVRFAPPRCVRWAVHPTVAWIMMLLGYRIRFTDGRRLPATPYLLVCNHRSAFDPLCTLAVSAQHTVFVAKPSVFRIPVIGTLMTRLGFMPIDRENARNAVTTIKQAAARIRDEGLCVGIYPEGTRSKTGEMLPFHAGSFKIATLAACPVVVAAIRYEKRGLWGKQVHLQIVDVMDVDYVAANGTATLAQRAQDAIAACLK